MPAVMRRTPGVYITELPAFPPSIVGVDTAVPAFIGYTEKAEIGGMPSYLQPIKIDSMADFEEVFGKPFKPLYEIKQVLSPKPTGSDDYDFKVVDPTGSSPEEKYYKLTSKEPLIITNALDEDADFGIARFNPKPVLSRYNLYNSMQLYYANGGGPCYVVSVGNYSSTVDKAGLEEGLAAIETQYGPTMLVIPDAVLLPSESDFSDVVAKMLDQCKKLQDRVAIIDVYDTLKVTKKSELAGVVEKFRTAVGEKALDYGMAYFPFLYTTIGSDEVDYQNVDTDSFTLFKNILYWEALNLYPAEKADLIKKNYIDKMEPYPIGTKDDVKKLDQNVQAAVPLLTEIEGDIIDQNSVLPPSAAMAGVYKYNDVTNGVWNAPANISLTSVTAPTYLVSADEQADLNVPLDGKAIDAIREFVGRGSVVWGARTLDGNSNDYRYIQVRRTLIYIEQSIKNALNQFVFAPNNGATWSTVVAMCSSFLQGVWSAGGLLGATPGEAFSVTCGLGSTMTATDILEGYMRVQVVLQMVRPAEFIELTFQQKMEGAA